MKEIINTFFADYGIPMFVAVMVLAALVGLARNFSKINSTNFEDKKEGLINIGIIMLYVLASVAIVTAVVVAVGKMSVKL